MEAKGGNLTEVAKALSVSRTTVYEWIETDKHFKQIKEESREALLDFTESQTKILIQGIPIIEVDPDDPEGKRKKRTGWKERPDTTLIIWVQKTLGKERGYVERSEITGKDGTPLQSKEKVDVTTLPDSVLDLLVEQCKKKPK